MFRKPDNQELIYLRTLVQDLLDRLERQEKQFAEERKALVAEALKPFRPRPVAPADKALQPAPKPFYPGFRPDLRPPNVEVLQPKGE